MPDDHVAASLYEQDMHAWAASQAAALRATGEAALRGDRNLAERLRALDWDNLAEEIEGLARRDRRELSSRLASIVEHLAKLEFSPTVAPRAGWSETVLRDRAEIESILQDSPSLRDAMPDLLAIRSQSAIRLAVRSLELHGEPQAAVTLRLSRADAPYRLEEVVDDWLPEAPVP